MGCIGRNSHKQKLDIQLGNVYYQPTTEEIFSWFACVRDTGNQMCLYYGNWTRIKEQ